VPGWSESGAMYDSGIEAPGAGPGAYTGTYAAYMRGPVSWDSTPAYSAYQLTAHSIAAGDVFTVDFAAAANWIETSTGEMSVYLYYNNGGSRVVMDMVTVSGMTVGGGWTPGTLSVAADDHAASIGHEIGIEFKNTGNGWTSVDNFSLTVSNTVADTTAPGAPTALVATSGDGSVGLDWANNSEPDLDSYTVYRSTVSNGIYAVVASGLTASTNTDNTVTNGTKYYYVVTATDSNANESVFSSPPVGVVPSAAIAPVEYYIADMVVDAGTNLTLTVSNSVLGHTYWILAADELASPTVWSNIMDAAGTGSDVLFGIPIDPVSINRFFKLDVQRQ